MEKDKLYEFLTNFEKQLFEYDFDKLPISDYNKQYIANLKSASSYYIKIYNHARIVGEKIKPLKKE